MNNHAQSVLDALRKQTRGLTRVELQHAAGLSRLDAQSFLRILRKLHQKEQIRFEGQTRARRYFLSAMQPATTMQGEVSQIPLSAEALGELELIKRPVSERAPVTYQRTLLDNYQPYLSAPLRERLYSMGRTPAFDAPAGTYVRGVLERFLIDLSWNSSRLEGNTYSLLDTERLLAQGAIAEGKPLVETQMLLNHKAAIEYLAEEPLTALSERSAKTLNALLMENLLGNRLDEGRLRTTPVQISGSTYVPLSNPQMIEECFRQIFYTVEQIDDPFEQSFFLLIHLPYLQPFIDGNKRTARLCANIPFISANLVPLSFADVPRDLFMLGYLALYEHQHIDILRDVFVWAYQRSVVRLKEVKGSMGQPDPLRLQYRSLLRELVEKVVKAKPKPSQVAKEVESFARRKLPKVEVPRFRAMAEVELESLHDGNFARYGLRPSEFDAWQKSRVTASRSARKKR